MKYAMGFVAVALWATSASAQQTVLFKHDQFPTSITEAASEIEGMSLTTNPGFVATEAFGQLHQPDAGDYPLRITGVELVLAAPPNASGSTSANAHIEFWFHSGTGADPGLAEPTFTISTADLYDRVNEQFGQPLQGNTAMQIEFDWTDPLDLSAHPPELTSGNFTVMVRFDDAAQNLFADWGVAQCLIVSGLSCGCQEVGTLQDQVVTPSVNVLNILSPLGTCSGSSYQWSFADEIGVSGDFVLRVRAETGGGTCTADCSGKECGDDGCGGPCGTCSGGDTCSVSGVCVPAGCTPDCTNQECGDDGCGGSCGSCAAGRSCSNGLCVGTNMPYSTDDEGGCAQLPGVPAAALFGLLSFLRRRRG